jgi:hypothetical protein
MTCERIELRANLRKSDRGFAGFARIALTASIVCLSLHAIAIARDGKLELSAIDRDTGKPIAVRVHLVNVATKRPVRPAGVPLLGDHFVFYDKIALTLPLGNYRFVMERGPEYLVRTGHFTINNFADDRKTVDMKRFVDMADEGWYSGDLEAYRRPRDVESLMEAEDLYLAMLLDVDRVTAGAPRNPARSAQRHGQEQGYTQLASKRLVSTKAASYSDGGNVLLIFDLQNAIQSLSGPTSTSAFELATEARQAGAWVDMARPFSWDLPLLVAANKLDSVQIAMPHFRRDGVVTHEAGGRPRDPADYPGSHGNARWSMDIYYHLLNCGLRLPPTAGSGSGWTPTSASTGSARGKRSPPVTANINPLGYNRVYVQVAGDFTWQKWWEALRAGRSMVTNGPLIRPSVEGQPPGYVFKADRGQTVELEVGLSLSTRDKISYLEIVKNGVTERSVRLREWKERGGRLPPLRFTESGWFLIRAVADEPSTYRFAATAPYYVEIGYQPRISRSSARFFLDWCRQQTGRIESAKIGSSTNTGAPSQQQDSLTFASDELRDEALGPWQAALSYWEGVLKRANSE